MNNTVHYGLFDTAVNSWLIHNNILKPGNTELIALVVQSGCTHHSEIVFPDIVHIGFKI